MKLGAFWCLVVVVTGSSAEQWRWPEAASVRIDTKIGFIDGEQNIKQAQPKRQDDEIPFHEPSETEGFYNRPPGSGRYPVRVEGLRNQAYRVDGNAIYRLKNGQKSYPSNTYEGTVDALQFCKCLNTPDCNPHQNSEAACGHGRYLCCFKKPNKVAQQNTEFFNEVEDERPMLLPGRENLARPFPPPPGSEHTGFYGHVGHPNEQHITPNFNKQQQPVEGVLVGPSGPTGVVGPQPNPDVLVGPGGPTGVIGPAQGNDDTRRSESAQRGVLVGPGGPTGIIGPNYGRRPVLVGPGGPTGIIGPGRSGRGPGVLVGPGGPTGIIGPGYGRRNPGILTGPGGPTGIIGPGRAFLVGPEGPTGLIGPQYFAAFNMDSGVVMLLPHQEDLARPFPPPVPYDFNPFFAPLVGSNNALIGVFDKQHQGILVAPDVPIDVVGPQSSQMFVPEYMDRMRRDFINSSTDRTATELMGTTPLLTTISSEESTSISTTSAKPSHSRKRKKTTLIHKAFSNGVVM